MKFSVSDIMNMISVVWSHEVASVMLSLLVLALGLAEFIPTDEWQKVGDDVQIPGGLDVQMNIDTGERFARLAQGGSGAGTGSGTGAGAGSDLALPDIHDKLNTFEDLAHDIDRGQEIMQQYFPALNALATSDDPQADQAAKIIQAALRHNPGAIKSVLEQDPNYPTQLVGDISHISWRSLSIFGSLVSTKDGANACSANLDKLLLNLEGIHWNNKILKRLETILEDLKHLGFSLDGWADSLQQAVTNQGYNELYQLKILTKIMELEPFKPSMDFLKWLSDLVSVKDQSDLVKYAKTVRHTVFGNKNADRIKSDL